jgi:hypothetical protein
MLRVHHRSSGHIYVSCSNSIFFYKVQIALFFASMEKNPIFQLYRKAIIKNYFPIVLPGYMLRFFGDANMHVNIGSLVSTHGTF